MMQAAKDSIDLGIICGDIHASLQGIRLRRDSLVSVMYPEGLNSAKSSGTHQRTDRHGILDQKPSDFQRSL